MKGLFIPVITAEMFRNGNLEQIEALMSEGEIYDIEYEPKWIPVSERRPVLFDRFYLVTVQLEPVGRATDYCVWDGLKWISPLSANPNVIAWMPKPEPYEEAIE